MVSRNNITGDKIQSRIADKNFRDNFDRIFGTTARELEKQRREEALQRLADTAQDIEKDIK